MNIVKKLVAFMLATLIILFLIGWSWEAFGFRSPVFAFLVTWLAMSWVALMGQLVQFSFAPKYYAPQPFERRGHVYERLGIRLFKRLVRRGPLAMFSPTLRLPQKQTVPALHVLDNEMRKAETGHVIIFVLLFGFVGYALLQGWLDAVVWLVVFNILINGYPIMLQRYNRIKLQELIDQQASGLSESQETPEIHGRAD